MKRGQLTKQALVDAANDRLAGIESLPDKRAVAQRYGVSTRTVDRWVAERRVPYLRLGRRCVRFVWRDVEAALSRFKIQEIK
jgi:excisionase family DNA binding protein